MFKGLFYGRDKVLFPTVLSIDRARPPCVPGHAVKSASSSVPVPKAVARALIPERGVETEQAQVMQGASP